ncbi:flavoprotein [Actinoplanes sp. NPDC051851]|uniref:flavoprotein n=1 Tax=Actinoplanes sp. NPDC051851 TaxID=3154753 RepID=UPI0034223A4C
MSSPTLCIVICGAGAAARVGVLVGLAQRDGWTVRLVATPSALPFLDLAALEARCGAPVRSDFRRPGEQRVSASTADAMIVAPATFNTVNKLAAGIADTYALNAVAEAIGRGRPVAILPYLNTALARRHPFRRSVEALRAEGVHVLFGPGEWEPHPPGEGGLTIDGYPWHLALAAVSGRCSGAPEPSRDTPEDQSGG